MEYCEINYLVKRADSIKYSNDFFSTSPVQKSYIFQGKMLLSIFDLKNVAFSRQPL